MLFKAFQDKAENRAQTPIYLLTATLEDANKAGLKLESFDVDVSVTGWQEAATLGEEECR